MRRFVRGEASAQYRTNLRSRPGALDARYWRVARDVAPTCAGDVVGSRYDLGGSPCDALATPRRQYGLAEI